MKHENAWRFLELVGKVSPKIKPAFCEQVSRSREYVPYLLKNVPCFLRNLPCFLKEVRCFLRKVACFCGAPCGVAHQSGIFLWHQRHAITVVTVIVLRIVNFVFYPLTRARARIWTRVYCFSLSHLSQKPDNPLCNNGLMGLDANFNRI